MVNPTDGQVGSECCLGQAREAVAREVDRRQGAESDERAGPDALQTIAAQIQRSLPPHRQRRGEPSEQMERRYWTLEIHDSPPMTHWTSTDC